MRGPKYLATITDTPQIVYLRIEREDFDAMIQLDTELRDLLAPSNVGYHDGHAAGGGETEFWSYGTDAEKLFLYMEATLQRSEFAKGCQVTLRSSDEDAPQRTFTLATYEAQRPGAYLT